MGFHLHSYCFISQKRWFYSFIWLRKLAWFFNKQFQNGFFRKMSWGLPAHPQVRGLVSHPRHSRWQGWIGREGWAARHLTKISTEMSCRTKNKKQATYRCRTKTHTHTSCRLDDYQTYLNTQNTHANLPLHSFGHAMDGKTTKKCHKEFCLMWACKIEINLKLRGDFWFSTYFSSCMTQGFWSPPRKMTSQHLFCSRGVASHDKTNARWNKNRKNYKVTFVNVKHLHATHDANVHRNRIAMEVSWSRGKLK